ncbi:hypothetical protein PFAG_04331 [Plasmodium falciparum Santa Lucia]|nr:hypothetical protein PFFVO_03929 [Plasmodium falciparum Vietnam Oak-Knoll (FVO)]ETW29663.1 hypothetical protein PFFCH_02933 [Plasmodium falciparum FCH/4]ETW34988.1 hypothetical protein PFTANZ_04299 [Plasmodium falciparum Tanzania (2000708)]ETW40850.1 hypothetical protein PFNF135_04490 [Plasmodium falciparum NF135/5.C10]ETW47778.1 hypothetical protein PFMALIP_04177 [Plasmodium falciparum MaliPS096_E11]ETW54807.1 hypothetical protein PFUGPA_03409 [Plasmodium falciparum Palo Alto/Uganda]ETW59
MFVCMMAFFSWVKKDETEIDEKIKKNLDEGNIKYSDISSISKDLELFRSLSFDNLDYHGDKCILARELIIIYMSTYKKHIEQCKIENMEIIIKTIKRTILSVNNIICNINEQILKCFSMIRNLYNDILKLRNVYINDYCLFCIIEGILNILNDDKMHESKSSIWGISALLSLIITNYKKAYFIYKGLISYKCIYTIPIFINNTSQMNTPNNKIHSYILKENDEFIGCNYSRIVAYVKLHLSVFIILNDTREIWMYLSELLNSAYRRKTYIYFPLIYAALDTTAYYSKLTFKTFFDKLINLIKNHIIPSLEQELINKPPQPDMQKIVDYYVKKLKVEFLSNDMNSSFPEGVVVIPDERILFLGIGS